MRITVLSGYMENAELYEVDRSIEYVGDILTWTF